MECENKGCSEVILRDELALHNSRCEKKEVPCQACGKSVTRDSMQEHVDSLCSHKRISCPLSCGTNLPRYVFVNVIYRAFSHDVTAAMLVYQAMQILSFVSLKQYGRWSRE